MKQITDANGFVEALRDGVKVYYREGGSYIEAVGVNPFTHPHQTFYRLQTEDEAIADALSELDKEEQERYDYTGQRITDEDYFRYGWEAHKEYVQGGIN
tara:strand:+ start:310 stop:606 length:297 start_codon:yes stop_codon:yes gene_type:complete